MVHIKKCPIETALRYIGKKWSINIIRDTYMGTKRFSEYLKLNPNLSTKMLSARLKELEKGKILQKNIINKHPVTIEYMLTKKGRALNKILYELSIFSLNEYTTEVCQLKSKSECITKAKKVFNVA